MNWLRQWWQRWRAERQRPVPVGRMHWVDESWNARLAEELARKYEAAPACYRCERQFSRNVTPFYDLKGYAVDRDGMGVAMDIYVCQGCLDQLRTEWVQTEALTVQRMEFPHDLQEPWMHKRQEFGSFVRW